MKPNLKIVNINEISPVMDYRERRVELLRQAIGKTGSIRNLFNLASVGAHEFLLLEDTSILEAVRRHIDPFRPLRVCAVPHAVRRRIRAGHQRCACRGADRVGRVAAPEPRALACQGVEVGGQTLAPGREGLRVGVIGHEEQDVRSTGHGTTPVGADATRESPISASRGLDRGLWTMVR